MRAFLVMLALSIAAPLLSAPPARAQGVAVADARVVLHVDGMHCATCPITVRVALGRVQGVRSATVDMGAHTATVVYDPRSVTPEALAQAVTDAGYPATVAH